MEGDLTKIPVRKCFFPGLVGERARVIFPQFHIHLFPNVLPPALSG